VAVVAHLGPRRHGGHLHAATRARRDGGQDEALVDSVDAYVLSMPSPVNRQRRCLHPVVRERQALVGQLQSLLRDLGLDRELPERPSLTEYLATKERERQQAVPDVERREPEATSLG
jgi:hypothetical protein